MDIIRKITYLIGIIFFLGCSNKKEYLKITEQKLLNEISSGSGISVINDTLYIIGDDATSIYKLDLNSYYQTKFPINSISDSLYREPRDIKHDFESVAYSEKYLYAFGSGSKDNLRDSLLIFNIDDPRDQRIISLARFYEDLRQKTGTSKEQWNIEGATVIGKDLLLCNRGSNMIIKVKLNDQFDLTDFAFRQLKLPAIEGKEARLSGACTLRDSLVLFCASVEDIPDWTKDGPILGSGIGVYSIKRNEVLQFDFMKDEQGRIVKEKVESVDIFGKHDSSVLDVVAVGDNDNGTTNFLRLRMPLKVY